MQLFFRQVGTGQPLVILHGLFGSCDNWLTISKVIAEQGFSVYAVDQRNHGRSPHAPSHTYPELAADLHDFLQQNNIENPILVGHSMGGKTVMQYAMLYPDTFSKLVVVDIAPKSYPVHHAEILKGLSAVPLTEIQNRNEAEAILSQYEPSPSVRQFLLKNLYRNEEGVFAWRINLPVINQYIELIGADLENTQTIRTPTLFIRGAESRYIKDTDFWTIQTLFPNVTLDTIENAGHWVQAEQPEAFVKSLMNFAK
ncbi:alpha/beta fold hydrolase [Runella sp. SP2]|uniref:alpha/beta fold hydrolase n=1 Tax=Runella sp. SP2 TaxID=2268026 RepID=UPI000F08AB2F|nr:alpha/beta fold hydrolase [Runella sp. SP2]AYQ32682.1 alpha/beta fold hydrolase [Runella sp. SP2]